MLPLYLLTSAKNQPILVELKNGETLNGQLINCDSWMNLTLKNVIQSSANGENFMKLPECYVRGNHIKYLRLPEEIMDYAKEQNIINMEQRNRNHKRRPGTNFVGRRNASGNNRNGYNRRSNQEHTASSEGHGYGHAHTHGHGGFNQK